MREHRRPVWAPRTTSMRKLQTLKSQLTRAAGPEPCPSINTSTVATVCSALGMSPHESGHGYSEKAGPLLSK